MEDQSVFDLRYVREKLHTTQNSKQYLSIIKLSQKYSFIVLSARIFRDLNYLTRI